MSSYITYLHNLAASALIFPSSLWFIPSSVPSVYSLFEFPQLDPHSLLESPVTLFSIKNADICPYWDWLSFATCNPPPNTYTLGRRGKGKEVFLSVHLSARSLSNLNLPNVAGRGQTTELRGTNAAGQPWCHTRAVCGVPGAQTAHTVYASTCSEIRTEPPTAMNLTGMM